MATVASVATALAVKVNSDTSVAGQNFQPLSKDMTIAAGSTKFVILPVVAGYNRRDSNVAYVVGSFAISFVHKLADATDENAYVSGAMLTDQAVVMDPDFYTDIAGVHEVEDTSLVLDLPEKEGNVVVYTVTVQLAIAP